MSNLKKIVIIFFVFLIIITTLKFKSSKDNFISVDNFSLETLEKNEYKFKMAKEINKKWKVKNKDLILGLLELDKYVLENEDIYYVIHYEPIKDFKENLKINLSLKLDDFNYHYIDYKDKINYKDPLWIHEEKENHMPKASVFIDSKEKSCFLSYTNVFNIKKKGVREEDIDLSTSIEMNKGKIILSLPNKNNTIVEQWGIISKENLVNWDNKEITDLLKRMDLNRVRKWGYDGLYYKVPKSYYPSNSKSFWRNPAFHVGNKFLDYNERFLKDFSIISLYTALNTQNREGIWFSSPRSKWLYDDYNIDGPFYDTRFNTDAALFLIRGFRKFNDNLLLKGAINYGDFFIEYAKTHNFKTKSKGYLVWDYANKDFTKIPNHVSLNHLVNEMNFLYELFIDSDEKKYLNIALKLKLAIKDTAKDWIKENGDLHYAYLVNGGYGLKDYKLLTLKDLQYSQKLFKKVDGKVDNTFNLLIENKEKYLKEKKIIN
ncbi:MAG: hypothetical protein FH751_14755 [Firmicutes bacterium]|nr:hypothetical protein [Bacillota bacterium]